MSTSGKPDMARGGVPTRPDWRGLAAPILLVGGLVVAVLGAWQITGMAAAAGTWMPGAAATVAIGLALALLAAGVVHTVLRQRAALRRSEARFRDFAEAGSDWFWEMGPDLRFTWFSDNFHQHTGSDAAWYLGKRRSELGEPRENPEAWQAHLDSLERHEPFHDFVYRLHGPDGPGQWTRTSGRPLFDDAGRFLGYRGASAICTEEVAALARAHAAEARLNAALGAMSDGFALYDADDRMVMCNDAYRTLCAADPAVLEPGVTFETFLRWLAPLIEDARVDPEGWIARRMAQHRQSNAPLYRTMPSGRHLRILERRIQDGGTVLLTTDVTELHRRERAVADSEARYALAFQGANEGVWDWDMASARVYGSERLWELIGIGGPAGWRDEAAYTDLMHPDDLESYRERVRAHFRGEASVYEAEYRIVRPDGEIRWIRSRGLGVRSADGTTFSRMAGSAADITAAKHAEFRLQRSEADLKAILDSARQAFVLLDRDGRIRAINRAGHLAATRMLGRDMGRGDAILDLVPPQERQPLSAGIERALSGVAVMREHHAQTPDGMVWLEISYTPVRRSDGEVDGVCWTVLDVTERRQAIDALARSEERFRSLVEHTQDVFGIVDAELRLRYVSDSVRRVLGHDPSVLVGREGGMLIHRDDRPQAQRVVRALAGASNTAGRIEARLRHADGSWRLLELNAVNRLDDPAVRGIIMTARDVTERRAAEAELRAAKETAESANRAKSHFLATVSHELRTPLNAVIGFSEIMRDGMFGPLPPRYRGYAADINHSGTHLLSLINDILDVSKAEAGKLELHEAPFDLGRALDECLRLVRERAEAAELVLAMSLPDRLPRLHGDERKVKQIVLNLLSNAVKFTNPGGRVELSVACAPSGELSIVVADSGIGIAKADLPKALAAFGQVDSALNRKYVGTGLGLTLVQAFAELHDAGFSLDSAPQVGTTVTVTFPPQRVLAA